MKLLRNISILVLLAAASAKAQVTSFYLFSKMDAWPQFQLHDGNYTQLMGYTKLIGQPIDLPSPVLIFNEGDSIDVAMHNFSQPAPHTIHLHGLDVNQQNDGVPHLSFYIPHDSVGHYTFIAPHAGTYLYHCHVLSTLHVQAGMYGMIIIRPPDGSNTTWAGGYAFDREHAWLFSEIDTSWHKHDVINNPYIPNSTAQILDYNPQYFLVNGNTEGELDSSQSSYTAAVGETVYLRLANIGYYGNRVIIPSALNPQIIDSDGRPLPSIVDSDTVEIMPGERYGVILTASSEFIDSIAIEYFNLNTQEVVNTQYPSVTIQGYAGINETKKESIELYPNPTNTDVYVSLKGIDQVEGDLLILDASGKQIFERSVNLLEGDKLKISTSNMNAGVYFVQIVAQNKLLTEKLIIE